MKPTVERPADSAGELCRSRRNFLAQAAAAAGGLSLGLTLPLPPAAGTSADPVYAAIDRYRQLSVDYTASVDRWAYLEPSHPDSRALDEDNSRACDAVFDQRDVLFNLRPATVAGVAALLNYISELEEWQMPPGLGDGHGKENVQAMCASLAAALDQIGVQA